jgi:trehalose-phosphatase
MSSIPKSETGQQSGSPASSTTAAPWIYWERNGWWEQLPAASRSVLILDYDGTLAPLILERSRAVMYSGVAERLLQLSRISWTRLVFVSGRPARDLLSLLPEGLRTNVWGSHGREELRADCSYHLISLDQAQKEDLVWFARSITQSGLASRMERKPGRVALHTLGLAAQEETKLMVTVREHFEQLRSLSGSVFGLEWLSFDGGVEVRGTGCTKATAIARILENEPSASAVALLGDNNTDEDAFRGLGGRGPRVLVLVRSEARPAAADLWLRPPEELLAFLDRWLEIVSQRTPEVHS